MNKSAILISLAVAISGFTISTQASANNLALKVCETIAADNKTQLRSALRTNKVKIRHLYKGVACNDMNMLEFAAQRNALNVGELIISKLPKSIVKQAQSTISKSSPLYAMTEKRIGK